MAFSLCCVLCLQLCLHTIQTVSKPLQIPVCDCMSSSVENWHPLQHYKWMFQIFEWHGVWTKEVTAETHEIVENKVHDKINCIYSHAYHYAIVFYVDKSTLTIKCIEYIKTYCIKCPYSLGKSNFGKKPNKDHS